MSHMRPDHFTGNICGIRDAYMPFNFTGLAGVYREAYLRNDPTVAFELRNGRGRFVFLIFFSEEDSTVKD